MSCSDRADCELGCGGVDCLITCDASRCSGSAWVAADCTNGARCDVDYVFDLYCRASRCEITATPVLEAACVDGARCTAGCRANEGLVSEPGTDLCSMSCDATSSCHLVCELACVMCCNGSTDCGIDCPSGGESCENGATVCGRPCMVDGRLPECPDFDSAVDDDD